MTPDPVLTADCRNCAALCCILLAFDEGPAFAFDKPAGQSCRHLGQDRRCTIHADLAEKGFAGCAAYDCHGAGQRATALYAQGADWRQDPEALALMDQGFRGLRRVHEALVLLRTAARLALTEAADRERRALMERLDAGRDWSLADLDQAGSGILEDIRRFLAGLRAQPGLTPPRR